MSEHQTVIITGATGGIGVAIARRFAQAKANVVINYSSNHERAQTLENEVKALGGNALVVQADVADFEATNDLVKKTLNWTGRVDVVVNNAGITKDQLMLRMKEEDYDKVLDINLKGAWNLCKHATRPMFKQKGGRIINITSVIGLMGNAGQVNYAASKAGMIGMTKSLAKEFGKKNVTVNAVAPGFIETEMTKDLDEDLKSTYLANIPLGRGGRPDEVAELVHFLASEKAAYITGETVSINGGMY
ncbi:MAG: 3-oxoacyl-[acyl-carrier-protein] reductase [Bacillota bacterium]